MEERAYLFSPRSVHAVCIARQVDIRSPGGTRLIDYCTWIYLVVLSLIRLLFLVQEHTKPSLPLQRRPSTMADDKKSSIGSDAGDVEAQRVEKDQLDVDATSADDRTGSKQETVSDPNIVDWDGPQDANNPMNWTGKAKIINTMLIIVLTLLTPLASSMFAPGVPDVLAEFGSTASAIPELVVSVRTLHFQLGQLLLTLTRSISLASR